MRRRFTLIEMLVVIAVISILASMLAPSLALGAEPLALAHRVYGAWHSGGIGGGGYLQHVVWAPSDPRRMYLTSDVGGCWRSDDGGEHWRMLHAAMPADASSYSLRGVAVDPRDADRAFFVFDSGVWLTTDGGGSFSRVLAIRNAGNGDNRSDGRVLVIDPRDPDTVYAAGMGSGFHRSRDGGKTWRRFGPENVNPVELYPDPANARRLWMAAIPHAREKLAGGLFLSEDGGETWEKISDEKIFELRREPWAGGALIGLERQKQVIRSTDEGRTWARFAQGLAPREKGGAREDGLYTAIDDGPGFLVLGAHGGNFYRLEKGWDGWRKVFERDPAKVDEGDWWGGLKRSYPHFGSALGYVKVSPHDPAHWAFTDWYALYQSRDAGRTWRLTIDGVEMTVAHCAAQDAANGGVVHAGVADVGYFRSEDGGDSWRQIGKGISNNVKCIAPALGRPGRLYATGPREWHWFANQLFRSDDDGMNWARPAMQGLPDMKDRRCNTVAVSPENPDEIYLAVSGRVAPGEGGVWRSTDGGESFAWMGEGLPGRERFFRTDIWVSGPEVAIGPGGHLVAVSDDDAKVCWRDRAAAVWREVQLPGGVQGVVADLRTPGRFWLCKKEQGLWRSDDGGRTWRQAAPQDAWHAAVDLGDPGRVAFNGAAGTFLSRDGGATWAALPADFPYRHARNVLAFCGDRLVMGTGGNGFAWMDIGPAAAR